MKQKMYLGVCYESIMEGNGQNRQKSDLEVKLKFSKLKDWLYYSLFSYFTDISVINFMCITKNFFLNVGISVVPK